MTIAPLPPLTVTAGDNTWYRTLTGDQHLPSADANVWKAMSGSDTPLANPGLVMQLAIGQTTNATRRAIANLYYRSVRVLRHVELGETLQTVATVKGLKDSRPKDDQHRGKVWIGIETTADNGPVVQYERCALVASKGDAPGHGADIPGPSEPEDLSTFGHLVPNWDLGSLEATDWAVGEERSDAMRDHVDMAPALARLTFNQAFVHRDRTTSIYGKRLVYGGHVQALAQSSLTRVLPGMATILGWDGCDHLAPAFEGDLLDFRHTLLDELAVDGGRLRRFEIRAARIEDDDTVGDDLLAWTPVVFCP